MGANDAALQPHLSAGYSRDQTGSWYHGLRIQANVQTHKRALRFALGSVARTDAVLDIATGNGAFLQALQDAGFVNIAGTTWNDQCTVDAPLYRVNLDYEFGIGDVGGRYALVTALEVIEHVENPAAFLRGCAAVLEPEGWLILSTPNVESVPARMQWLLRGCPWSFREEEVERNRHISILWGRSVRHLARAAGLEVVSRHGDGELGEVASGTRRLIYSWLEKVLPGEPRGLQSHYVLRHTSARADLGPQSVY